MGKYKKLSVLLGLALIALVGLGQSSVFWPDVILTNKAGVWVDSRAYSSLSAAIASIGATECDLRITRTEVCTNPTIPANIRLSFSRLGRIANSGTLTLSSPNQLNALPTQYIFSGAGPVTFSKGGTVSPDWFGQNTIPGTTNMHSALSKAIGSIPSGILKLNGVAYRTTSLTISSGKDVDFSIVGSSISTDIANTLDIYSPSSVKASPSQQVFIGLGSIVFSSVGEMSPNWIGTDAAALNACVAALPVNSKIKLVGGTTYSLGTTTWTVSKAIEIEGYNNVLTYTGTGTAVLYGEASGVRLYGGRVKGLKVLLDPLDWINPTIGFHFRNCYEGTFDVEAEGFNIGLLFEGLAVGCVYNNIYPKHIKNCKVSLASRETTGGWSRQNTIIGGRFDQASEAQLNSRASKTTVSFASADSSINDSEGGLDYTTLFSPDDFILVTGSASNDGVYKISTVAAAKIVISETYIAGKATPIITTGAGASISITQVSIHVYLTTVSGWGLYNTSFESTKNSISNLVIDGGSFNYVYGSRIEVGGTLGWIYVNGQGNRIDIPFYLNRSHSVIVGTNSLTELKTWKGDYRSYYQSVDEKQFHDSASYIKLRNSSSIANEVIVGYDALNNYQRMGLDSQGQINVYNSVGTEIGRWRALQRSGSTYSSSGTGEDDLHTFTLAANTLGSTGGLLIRAYGDKTGAAGNKTIKFHFGSSATTVFGPLNTTSQWRLEVEILSLTDAAQRISWKFYDASNVYSGYTNLTIDTTSNQIIKLTGECADAGDVIAQGGYVVQMF